MHYNYVPLSMGSNNRRDNEQLQLLLNEKNNAGLVVDGIYGPKTNQAVINFQKANGLEADGIVGDKTWAALLGRTDETDSLSDAVAAAKKQYEDLSAQTPGDFSFSDQALYDQAEQAYLNRDAFAYDLNGDPLYRQYKDQYTNAGRLAMEDTMGKAAALTGGYGNSYAQTAGQQAYGSYLQQLNERVPELYELAYSKYQQQGDALRDRYALLKDKRDDAYSMYQDSLSRHEARQDDLYSKYQDALDQQAAAFEKLSGLIALGYNPTDRELKEAGMTRRQANAIAKG